MMRGNNLRDLLRFMPPHALACHCMHWHSAAKQAMQAPANKKEEKRYSPLPLTRSSPRCH